MKIEKYLGEGAGKFRRMASKEKYDASITGTMKLKQTGASKGKHDKAIDAIYNNLMKVPEFKRLSMDRQGEISMKVLALIMGKG